MNRSALIRLGGLTTIAVFAALDPEPLASQDFDQVQIRTTQITESIYLLQGSGGNIAVSIGEDGTFIVDDQFAPLTERIQAAIAALTDLPVDFVVNTHWHYDHTDGNENFGRAGAVIVSHENSRQRMMSDQYVRTRLQEAYSPEGLPKITFDESLRFHYNGETVDVFHVENAHTDGDAFVYFRNSDVVHTGDVFNASGAGLPFIDQPNGGSIDGIIDAVYGLAAATTPETKFIPGHGPLSTREDLLAYGERLSVIRDRVQSRMEEGDSFEEVLGSDPVRGFVEPGTDTSAFVQSVYDSLEAWQR